MNILYITQYFYPEICAPSDRALANVRYLSSKGHNLTIIAEIPNHPKGVIFPGYRGKIIATEKKDRLFINRVWVLTSPKKNFTTRILFYVSFMFSGLICSLLRWRKYDIVYISSPPLFVGIIGIVLNKLFKRTQIVFEVRDLWPKSAIVLGELKNTKIIKLSELLEKKIYNISSLIVSITKGIHDEISRKYQGKSIFLPNGVDLHHYGNITKNKVSNLSKFIVVYAGTHGLIHGLEIIIHAAEILKNKDIYFEFYGDGPVKENLIDKSHTLGLNKVRFFDSVGFKEISNHLQNASVGLSTTKKLNLCKGSIPVKIFSYMACSLPVILSGWGESVDIIKKADCGIVTIPENVEKLVNAILWMKENPSKRIKMGLNGRKFIEKNYNRRTQAQELEKKLILMMEN